MAKKTGRTARPTKRDWTTQELDDNAKDFVACYGPDYCWDEFVYEYIQGFESDELRRPDEDALFAAIYRAVKAAKAGGDAGRR